MAVGKIPSVISEFMEKINDVLDEWEDLSYKPNSVRQVEDMLDRFYTENNLDARDFGRFDTDLTLNDDQIEELRDIATTAYDKDIWLEDFESKFEKAKGKHDLNTLEDYADFADKNQRFSDSVLSSSKMNYYAYEALVKKAQKKGYWYSEKRVNKMIENAFLNKGKEGEDLYNYIYTKLSK